MNHRDYDRLHGPKMLQQQGEHLSAAEAVVRMAANPLWLPHDPKRERHVLGAEHIILLHSILRTGAHFVFARDDVPIIHREPVQHLPPLPFPRMWIEIAGLTLQQQTLHDFDGHICQWFGFAIIEEAPYERWRVLCPMIDVAELTTRLKALPKNEADHVATRFDQHMYEFAVVREWDLARQDNGWVGTEVGTDLNVFNGLVADGIIGPHHAAVTRGWTEFPCTLIELIHTLGVSHRPFELPRPRRREHQRRYGVEHPNIYWVHLRSTNESEQGKGDREYHHRWLVRGHYRKQDGGPHVVAGKGPCTWVRPYVKGPEGAPWKGRPIYTTVAQDAA